MDIAKQSYRLNRSLGRQVEDAVFSRVCVARAFQQRCCFFAVTSVTQGTEVGRQVDENAAKGRKKKHRFFNCQSRFLKTRAHQLLK